MFRIWTTVLSTNLVWHAGCKSHLSNTTGIVIQMMRQGAARHLHYGIRRRQGFCCSHSQRPILITVPRAIWLDKQVLPKFARVYPQVIGFFQDVQKLVDCEGHLFLQVLSKTGRAEVTLLVGSRTGTTLVELPGDYRTRLLFKLSEWRRAYVLPRH